LGKQFFSTEMWRTIEMEKQKGLRSLLP